MTSVPRTAHAVLDPRFPVAEVNPRLFGSFLEHLGRAVYTGVFEPDHPTADADGLRTDVARADPRTRGHRRALSRRQLRLRLPLGGRGRARSSRGHAGWTWRGARSRPTGSASASSCASPGPPAWSRCSRSTSAPAGWPRRASCSSTPIIPGGTAWSDLRRAHGRSAAVRRPAVVSGQRDGRAWQIGHLTADEYGRLAAATGQAMRMVDPDSNWSPAAAPAGGCRPSGSGRRPCSNTPTTSVDYISCTPTTRSATGTSAVSSPPRRTWRSSSTR